MVALLIDHGADVDKANNSGETPLCAAAEVSRNISLAGRVLISRLLVCSLLYFMLRRDFWF